MRRWKLDEKFKLITLYLDAKLTIAKIAAILGRSKPATHNMLCRLKIANRCKLIVHIPNQITPEEARVHAHVCGDGSLSISERKRRKTRELEFRVRYTNKDRALLEEFKQDVKIVYNRAVTKYRCDLAFSSKRVFKHLKDLGAGDSHSWFISERISKGSIEVRKMWLRAFWDDEGTVRADGLVASSVNYIGLVQVCSMMHSVGVNAHITGPYRDKGSLKWHLRVNKKDVVYFATNIGFTSPMKANKLSLHVLLPALPRDLNPDDYQDNTNNGQDNPVNGHPPVHRKLGTAGDQEEHTNDEHAVVDHRSAGPYTARPDKHHQGTGCQQPHPQDQSTRSLNSIHPLID